MQNLTMPKKYLSYSQMRLWLDDKEKYRDRYYKGDEGRVTQALMFGSEIAKGLEDGTVKIPNLVILPVPEFKINVDVDGVPFFAYIDQYDPGPKAFRESKTGQMKQGGKPRWTQKDVDQHMQLDVYSLLIQLSQGSVQDLCHLDWLHVRHKTKYIEFASMTLESESNQLELTGEVTSFERIVTQTERDRIRILISTVAREISVDYAAYLKQERSFLN